MSLKEQIKNADDRGTETVEVPEWGVTIELRSPTVEERSALIAATQNETDDRSGAYFTNQYVSLLIATAHDPETGERLFDEADAEWLAKKNGKVVNDVWDAAQRVSGLNVQAVDEAKGDS